MIHSQSLSHCCGCCVVVAAAAAAAAAAVVVAAAVPGDRTAAALQRSEISCSPLTSPRS